MIKDIFLFSEKVTGFDIYLKFKQENYPICQRYEIFKF